MGAVPAAAVPLRLRQELSLEERKKILKAEAKELGLLLMDDSPYAGHESRLLLLPEVPPALVRGPPEKDLANNEFWDNDFHRRGEQSMEVAQVADRAKGQTIEEVLDSATKLAHAARWLWNEARFRIGEEHRFKYAAECGLVAPLPPSDPPFQETPSPSPNSRSLRRSTRARRQRQRRVQELAEQAQEDMDEAQPEAGREEEEEEAIQKADQPQVPAGQVSQEEREEGNASSSSFALASRPESMAEPEEEQDLEGLGAGAGVIPEPAGSVTGPAYTNL
ncbi:hypothetical protein KEM55_003263 [Ascosphaera atra]|nr:hypothetical protein KEM55_003263 [Ascosphaera atra]